MKASQKILIHILIIFTLKILRTVHDQLIEKEDPIISILKDVLTSVCQNVTFYLPVVQSGKPNINQDVSDQFSQQFQFHY